MCPSLSVSPYESHGGFSWGVGVGFVIVIVLYVQVSGQSWRSADITPIFASFDQEESGVMG